MNTYTLPYKTLNTMFYNGVADVCIFLMSSISKTKKTSKTHTQSLEALKDKDPEFYEFLKEEGKDLLAFNESDG